MKADVTVRCPHCDAPVAMMMGVDVVDGKVDVTIPDSCMWCKAVIRDGAKVAE
jgi:hypothetical protein